jgi:hypothetical protein
VVGDRTRLHPDGVVVVGGEDLLLEIEGAEGRTDEDLVLPTAGLDLTEKRGPQVVVGDATRRPLRRRQVERTAVVPVDRVVRADVRRVEKRLADLLYRVRVPVQHFLGDIEEDLLRGSIVQFASVEVGVLDDVADHPFGVADPVGAPDRGLEIDESIAELAPPFGPLPGFEVGAAIGHVTHNHGRDANQLRSPRSVPGANRPRVAVASAASRSRLDRRRHV